MFEKIKSQILDKLSLEYGSENKVADAIARDVVNSFDVEDMEENLLDAFIESLIYAAHTAIEESHEKTYQAGYNEGYSDGENDGFDKGYEQAEYDLMED